MNSDNDSELASERLARQLQEEEDCYGAFFLQSRIHDSRTDNPVRYVISDEDDDDVVEVNDDNNVRSRPVSIGNLSLSDDDFPMFPPMSPETEVMVTDALNTAFSSPHVSNDDVMILGESSLDDTRPSRQSRPRRRHGSGSDVPALHHLPEGIRPTRRLNHQGPSRNVPELHHLPQPPSQDAQPNIREAQSGDTIDDLVLTIGRRPNNSTSAHNSIVITNNRNSSRSPTNQPVSTNTRSRNRQARDPTPGPSEDDTDLVILEPSGTSGNTAGSSSSTQNLASGSARRQRNDNNYNRQRFHNMPRNNQMSVHTRIIINGVPIRAIQGPLADAQFGLFNGIHQLAGIPGMFWSGNDSMTYEDMAALDSENQLEPGQGLSTSGIRQNTLTKTYNPSQSTSGSKNCNICLTDFSSGDKLRTLPCFHTFHAVCIDNWLTRKPECPVCRTAVGNIS